MKLRKILSAIIAICLLLSVCQLFTFAAQNPRPDVVFLGNKNGKAEYLEIGEDMNGVVGVAQNDSNPVPENATYTNGFYVQGAQLRSDGSLIRKPNITGLRFVIVNNLDMISKMEKAGLKNISYGAFASLDTGLMLNESNSKKVPANNIFQTKTDLGSADYQKFTVNITNILGTNITTDVMVRPYLTYTDIEGKTQTIYGEQYRCNVYALAHSAFTSDKESSSMKTALKSKVLSYFPANIGKSESDYALGGEYTLNSVETKALINKYRKITDDKINEIKNTPNMEIPKGATVYYVSNKGSDGNDGKSPNKAWKSLDKVSSAALKAGDYVLFERGGYFRGALSTKAGVTYSAYGEGKKPIICGSPEDGADPNKWVKVSGNVWEYQTTFEKDIGSMVFNHGEAYAVKWLVYTGSLGILQEYKTKANWTGVSSLKKDLDFWHSTDNKKIYLCSTENPGKRFSSIEFLQNVNAVGCGGDNVTIDNITVKYTGAHGIGGGTKKNFTVQNCTFEWIGGSVHHVSDNKPVRFGNAIEIYGGCDGFLVENCYFNNIYDAAVTHQYNFADDPTSTADRGHYNVRFANNVMERCVYSIEYFLGKTADSQVGIMNNVVYENNLMWYAGEGLGSQRPDETQPAHIKGWSHWNDTGYFTVRNNFAAYSTAMLVHSDFRDTPCVKGVSFLNNIFVGTQGQKFGLFEYREDENSWGGNLVIADYNVGSAQSKIEGSGGQNVTASGNRYYFVTQ